MPNPMDAIYKVEADATSTPAINLHKILGPRIIGAWLNLMLYVLVIDRALHYFQHYPTDKILLKITVFATLGWDTAMTVASCADVYLNAVIFQGNIPALLTLRWTQSIYLASTGISGAIVQTFMLHRYWALTRRKVVIGAVGLVILLSLASNLYLTVIIRIPLAKQARTPTLLPAILWLSAAMAADLLIALLLVLYYQSIDRDRTHSSRILLRRLVALALKTGSFTALTAVLALIAYASDINSNVTLIFSYCIGSIYSLTLLYNLNIRHNLFPRAIYIRSSRLRVPDLERSRRVTLPPVASN